MKEANIKGHLLYDIIYEKYIEQFRDRRLGATRSQIKGKIGRDSLMGTRFSLGMMKMFWNQTEELVVQHFEIEIWYFCCNTLIKDRKNKYLI